MRNRSMIMGNMRILNHENGKYENMETWELVIMRFGNMRQCKHEKEDT